MTQGGQGLHKQYSVQLMSQTVDSCNLLACLCATSHSGHVAHQLASLPLCALGTGAVSKLRQADERFLLFALSLDVGQAPNQQRTRLLQAALQLLHQQAPLVCNGHACNSRLRT